MKYLLLNLLVYFILFQLFSGKQTQGKMRRELGWGITGGGYDSSILCGQGSLRQLKSAGLLSLSGMLGSVSGQHPWGCGVGWVSEKPGSFPYYLLQ